MEDLKTKAEDLSTSVKDYVETYYKLSILKASDKATSITAGGLAAFAILFLGIFVLFFLGLSLGAWLGDILESDPLGYLIVAVLFIIIIGILVLMRKKIVFPMIRNILIRKLYE